jgi:hypothetical protein
VCGVLPAQGDEASLLSSVTTVVVMVCCLLESFSDSYSPAIAAKSAIPSSKHAPNILQDLKSNAFIGNLNEHYGIIDSLQTKFTHLYS